MNRLVAVVWLLAVLVLVGYRLPRRRWPVVIATTLAAILLLVLVERSGLWPTAWHVR